MVISIKRPEARILAKEVAQMLGTNMTDAIKISLREHLDRIIRRKKRAKKN